MVNQSSSRYHSYELEWKNSFDILSSLSDDIGKSIAKSWSTSSHFSPTVFSTPTGDSGRIRHFSKHTTLSSITSDDAPPEPGTPKHGTHSSVPSPTTKTHSDVPPTTEHTTHFGGPLCMEHKTHCGVPPVVGNNWRTLFANGESAACRKAELGNLVSYTNPDVLILTGTHLDAAVNTSEFFPLNYQGSIRRIGMGRVVALWLPSKHAIMSGPSIWTLRLKQCGHQCQQSTTKM